MKLDTEVKAKWLAGLRSSKFKQGQGQLHHPTNNTYCCLGVLCVVNDKHLWYKDIDELFQNTTAWPDPTQVLLMGMNDIDKKSFSEIATCIEENL